MRISFPILPGVRVSGRVGARRGQKPTGCTWFLLSIVVIAIAVHYWVAILTFVGLVIVAILLIALLNTHIARRHRLLASFLVGSGAIGIIALLVVTIGPGGLRPGGFNPATPSDQPWIGRDLNGDGKCFDNQYASLPCPDTGWVPWPRPDSTDSTTTPPTDMAAPLTPTEDDDPFWSAVQTRTGFKGTQARITAINHGRFICRELARGIDRRIVAAQGVADVQYTSEQFQTVMTTAVEFLCPQQGK